MKQIYSVHFLSSLLGSALLALSTASSAAALETSQFQGVPLQDDLTTPLVTGRAFIPYADNMVIVLLRWRRDEDTALSYSLSKHRSEEARRILTTLRRENLDAAAALTHGLTLSPPEDLVDFLEAVRSH